MSSSNPSQAKDLGANDPEEVRSTEERAAGRDSVQQELTDQQNDVHDLCTDVVHSVEKKMTMPLITLHIVRNYINCFYPCGLQASGPQCVDQTGTLWTVPVVATFADQGYRKKVGDITINSRTNIVVNSTSDRDTLRAWERSRDPTSMPMDQNDLSAKVNKEAMMRAFLYRTVGWYIYTNYAAGLGTGSPYLLDCAEDVWVVPVVINDHTKKVVGELKIDGRTGAVVDGTPKSEVLNALKQSKEPALSIHEKISTRTLRLVEWYIYTNYAVGLLTGIPRFLGSDEDLWVVPVLSARPGYPNTKKVGEVTISARTELVVEATPISEVSAATELWS